MQYFRRSLNSLKVIVNGNLLKLFTSDINEFNCRNFLIKISINKIETLYFLGGMWKNLQQIDYLMVVIFGYYACIRYVLSKTRQQNVFVDVTPLILSCIRNILFILCKSYIQQIDMVIC